MTHDYRRNGTTTLFAALNTLDGTVISDTMPRHRHDEWLRFLKRLHRETPKNLVLHIICDNYATHKHPAVMEWLEEHKRVHIHFTPTSSSWLNMVERFFRSLDPEERMRSSGLQFGHSVPFHHDLPVALEWSVRVPRLGAASTRVPRPGADPHFRFGLSVLASCGRKVRSVCRPPNGSTLVRVISTAPTRQSGTILWAAFQQH